MITILESLVKEVANGLKKVHKLQGKDMKTNKKSLRKRIDKIDKMITEAFESGTYKNSESLQNTINKWGTERRSLIIKEQEILKATITSLDKLKICN